MNLWPHQVRAIELTRESMKLGHHWVLIVKPTGSGKTVTSGYIVKSYVDRNPDKQVLFVVHRVELLEQTFDSFTAVGLQCGVIQASPTREVNPFRPVQIASLQTMLAREPDLSNVGLVVCDEAHHLAAGEWIKPFLELKKRGVFAVGLTATPTRADGLGLGELFDDIVTPVTMKELIAQGVLVPYELKAPPAPVRKGALAQSPVSAYQTHAPGRKAILFARHIKDAEKFVEEFRAAGIAADIVTGTMGSLARRSVMERYKQGSIQVLMSVGILTEGFDDRPTDCVILARSIGSVGLYVQCCGRALRSSPGKTNAVILDLWGSSYIHGAPDDDRVYSLEGEGIRSDKLPGPAERFCKVCGCLMDTGSSVCPDPSCGKGGTQLSDIVNVRLVKYAAKRKESPNARAETLGRWMNDARSKGYKPGWAFAKYKAVYGENAPNDIVSLAMRRA